jgi:hypothetical protein
LIQHRDAEDVESSIPRLAPVARRADHHAAMTAHQHRRPRAERGDEVVALRGVAHGELRCERRPGLCGARRRPIPQLVAKRHHLGGIELTSASDGLLWPKVW